jgi:hypothetical protein
LGATSIESPLRDATIVVPKDGKVDLGKLKPGFFTFIETTDQGKGAATAVLLLPGSREGCFSLDARPASVAQADPSLAGKFLVGLKSLDRKKLEAKWVSKLGATAIGAAAPVLIYCSLAVSGAMAGVFAVSCVSSLAGVAAEVGVAYLQAAREVLLAEQQLTQAESELLNRVFVGLSLGVSTTLSIVTGKLGNRTLAEVLSDPKVALKVVGAAVKVTTDDTQTQTGAAVGLAFTAKYVTVAQVLAKTAK